LGAPTTARHFAADVLLRLPGDGGRGVEAAHEVALVVSELASNALNACASTVTVDIAVHHDPTRVAVSDDAPGQPQPRHPAVTDEHGRGLLIVQTLACQWEPPP
jgi:two-component sensor histidine kinase